MRFRVKLDLPPFDGGDVETLEVREGLSSLFAIVVSVAIDDPSVELEGLLAQTCRIDLETLEGAPVRTFTGEVHEAAYLGPFAGRHRYELCLAPSIAALRHRVRTRMFQSEDTIAIVKKVLGGAGIDLGTLRIDTVASYAPRELCTQWKESELDFVLRLLEDEGIFFRFAHDAAGCTMHLADSSDVHEAIDALPFVPWHETTEEAVTELVFVAEQAHDAFRAREWDESSPANVAEALAPAEPGARERYEYPGRFARTTEGARIAAVRIEEARVWARHFRGRATSARLEPGKTLFIEGASQPTFEGELLVLEATHRFDRSASEGSQLECLFVAIPAEVPFRPARKTKKPRALELEQATVVGPAGEEIHTDAMGRVKVRFQWDREANGDDTASPFFRVMQPNTTGSLFLPRVGWEVQVAFLDGDPDRPVVLHRVWNDASKPPYALPAAKTSSSLRTATYPGGGAVNELKIEDGNGSMELGLHAARDLRIVVAHDLDEAVTVNVQSSVTDGLQSIVGGAENASVGGDSSLSVEGTVGLETTGNKTIAVGGSEAVDVTGTSTFTVTGGHSETIGGMRTIMCSKAGESVAGSTSRSVGAAQAWAAGGPIVETVAGGKTELVGAAKVEIITKSKAESFAGSKTLTSGVVAWNVGGGMSVKAKGAVAITSAGAINEKIGKGFAVTGEEIRITTATFRAKGGGSTFTLSGSTLKIDGSKFGGKGGPMLILKGKIDYAE